MTTLQAFETIAIHAGQEPDPATGAVMTPIFQTSTYRQEAVGVHQGYEYSRTGNPTRAALERCMMALEDGKGGLAFASGMAAADAVLHLLESGDHVLAAHDLYGGSYRLFEKVFRQLGLEFTFANAADPEDFIDQAKPNTKLIWLETPTNPLLDLSDIQAIADLANTLEARPLICVDNTFATPFLQQPLALGADIVLHSTTKYLGGHSDVVGGALVASDPGLVERLAFLQNAIGAVPGPMDCFLVLRGIKTLPIRMERHAENALRVAKFLEDHPAVSQVRYPGLRSHPQAELAARQMRNGGGMLTFRPRGGASAARKMAAATKIFTLAESLGGVESLIEMPAEMTHLSVAGSTLEVPDDLVRLSVGLEGVEDLIADLDQSLEVAS
ncbi:MAG: cystathionine gamma-synthase [Anaerolineales bacterium]